MLEKSPKINKCLVSAIYLCGPNTTGVPNIQKQFDLAILNINKQAFGFKLIGFSGLVSPGEYLCLSESGTTPRVLH